MPIIDFDCLRIKKFSLDLPISALPLSTRAKHSLMYANIRTIGVLIEKRHGEMLAIKNMGRLTLQNLAVTVCEFMTEELPDVLRPHISWDTVNMLAKRAGCFEGRYNTSAVLLAQLAESKPKIYALLVQLIKEISGT